MKPTYLFAVFSLLLISCTQETRVEKMVFVKNGKAISVIEDFNGWERHEGYLLGTSRSNMLFATRTLKEDDFEIKFRVSVHDIGEKPVCFIQLPNLHFYINGINSESSFYLNDLNSGKSLDIHNNEVKIKDGEPFNIAVVREGSSLTYFIDDVLVYEHIIADSLEGMFGIYPFRAASSSLRVYDFSVSGEFTELAENRPLRAVFHRGEGGYNTFRVPAIILTPKETLLAFCEGRKNSREDLGDIDLFLKRSHDFGETWGELELLYEKGGNDNIAFSCPTPFIDQSTGILHLVITRDAQRILHLFSSDEGLTWSQPRDITEVAGDFDFTWHRIASSPGHAIQLKQQPHAGRCVVSIWLNDTIKRKYVSATIFSDDGGDSWSIGGILSNTEYNTSESQTVEMESGSLLQNIRVQEKTVYHRAFSKSLDGGITWSELTLQEDFTVRMCGGSMIGVTDSTVGSGTLLISSNPASPQSRTKLTLSCSKNGGETWPYSKLVHPGPSAMSDLAVLPDGSIGCLYEAGYHFGYEMITFERFEVEDLIQSSDQK